MMTDDNNNKVSIVRAFNNPPKGIRVDPRYAALFRIYRQLKDNVVRDSSIRKQAYPCVSTNELFEVYMVCILCELLQEEGWHWKNGWVGHFGTEMPTFTELRSGEEITFRHEEGYTMEIAYDKKISRNVEDGYFGFETLSNQLSSS